VGEALVSGGSPVPACAEVGRALAQDGASLGEALSWLSATYDVLSTGSPPFAVSEALSVSWSEATLEHLHEVTCEDPLTGLSSVPHLRTRLSEVYREAERRGRSVRQTHALVVTELTPVIDPDGAPPVFVRALRLAGVADVLRSAFSGEETIARAGQDRVVALVPRGDSLGSSVALTRELLYDLEPDCATRIWVEGLPGRADLAFRLLGDLCA
jgi:GGDEF domain-containing protein